MTLKMAAPFRHPAVLAKSLVKACRRQLNRELFCRVEHNHNRYLKYDACSGIGKVINDISCKKCMQKCMFERVFSKNYHTLNFFCQRYYCSSSFEDRKCWKCGAETNNRQELFFCNCGVVQEVPSDLDYFAAMGAEETFDIDIDQLANLYKNLQRRLHPDKYSQKSKEEQAVADKQSAYINKAYTTLLRPLSRGLYLLELHGDPIDESNTAVDPEFLMLMMEINEELSEHQHDTAIVRKLEKENAESLKKCVNSVSEAFRNKDIADAKKLVIKLKYYTNIEEKIKEILRHKMDRWSL